MGRVYKMSWEAGRKRWAKMHKGQRFLVTCEELNAPPTAEGSYHAANQWWEAKLGELLRPQQQEQELLNRLPPDELDRLIEQGRAAEQLKWAKGANDKPPPPNKHEIIATVVREDGNTNLRGLQHLVGKASGKPVEADRTIGYQVKRFLALELARGKKPLTYQSLDYHLSRVLLCPHLGKDTGIESINAQTVSNFYSWLRNDSGMSDHSQWKCFCCLKSLVRFLWGEDLIELPKNLNDRRFSFENGAKVIKNYPVSQVRELLAQLPERLRLYACLALNTGALGVDIGTLRHDELQGNRIIRKRTKTSHHDSVPVVNYLLWDETLTLLNKHRSNHPELVLTTERGTPLWESRNVKGKTTLLNYVKVQWCRRKLPIPFKALRSISANLLKEGGYDLQLQQVFLCHAPSTIAERHYVNYSQAKLDEAVLWLRGQFFAS